MFVQDVTSLVSDTHCFAGCEKKAGKSEENVACENSRNVSQWYHRDYLVLYPLATREKI
jgi:hypothetical protein